MWHSLRFRLLLTIVGVALIAIAAVALVANQGVWQQFQFFLRRDSLAELNLIAEVWAERSGGLEPAELQALSEELGRQYGVELALIDESGRVSLASEPGLVGADEVLHRPENLPAGAAVLQIRSPGRPVDTVWFMAAETAAGPPDYLFVTGTGPSLESWNVPLVGGESELPAGPSTTVGAVPAGLAAAGPVDVIGPAALVPPRDSQELFLGAVTRTFLLAVGGALLIAVALSVELSRRILRPVQDLTGAARKLELGDLGQRVAVRRGDEIGQLAHAFNAMASALQQQEAWRREMISDVAHELRTPLANIRGYLEGIRDEVIAPEPATIRSLHEEALLLGRLVDDLQELSLAEAGQLRLARQPLQVAEVVAQVIQAMAPMAQAHRVTLAAAIAPDLPPVQADPERVGQVLRNLLNNAIAYSQAGGQVRVVAEGSSDRPGVTVYVQDTGPGIAPEHLPRVFDRFYRTDESRARASGGAGLGLAIAKAVVELHGGRIWVESEPGRGATFSFSLPAGRPQ
jgi:signal transduction histidine kinase